MNWTREKVFALLAAAYTGPGSVDEGSFAGDVLRACADGLAQIWSMDVEGLARRAFVSTAVGEDLTAVCADRGVVRQEGEGDEALRARALQKLLATPASGNADHYAAWCAGAEGILRVRVLPLARGAGTVDIVAAASSGGAPEAGVLAAAQAAVDRERPVGADARVVPAAEQAVDVSATVTLLDGGSLSAVTAAFSQALDAFFRDRALRTRTVSFAQCLRLLLDCPGVADVTGFTLLGGGESLPLPPDGVAVRGEITLKEAGT